MSTYAAAQQPALDAPAIGLLQLAPDVLRRIWDLLPCSSRHALRRTCTALRDTIDAWERTLFIKLRHAQADPRGELLDRYSLLTGSIRRRVQPVASTALEHAQATLATFPAAATLAQLVWSAAPTPNAIKDDWLQPDVLRSFLRQGSARFAALTLLEIHDGPVGVWHMQGKFPPGAACGVAHKKGLTDGCRVPQSMLPRLPYAGL